MTKVRKRAARGPGGPACARGARAAAPATWLLRPQDASARGPGIWVWPAPAGPSPPRPPGFSFLSCGSSRGARGRAPRPRCGVRAPARRAETPRARLPLCLWVWAKDTTSVLFSRSSSRFKSHPGVQRGRGPWSPEKTTCLFKNKRVPRRPAAASPFPFTRRLQKWRLCPDPNQVTIGDRCARGGLTAKQRGT